MEVVSYWGRPRVWGNKGIYFRETREQRSKNEGNRGTKAILGNREHRKWGFWFWGTKKFISGFCATSLLTYDFSTLYTTLPHNLIKEKLIHLIEWTLKREGSPYLAWNERQAFFTSGDTKWYKLWSCQNVCAALIYLLDNIYIRFGTKLNRQIVGIPMGTNCAPLVADLFLFCYERVFMTSLSDVKGKRNLEVYCVSK